MRDYRIVTAHVNVATLTGSDDYLIRNFPKQDDMKTALLWMALDHTPPEYVIINTSISGKRQGQGKLRSAFIFRGMTYDMVEYWLDEFLPSGAKTGNVTVATYDEIDAIFYMQCKIQRPDFSSIEKNIIGYPEVIWSLTSGVEIT